MGLTQAVTALVNISDFAALFVSELVFFTHSDGLFYISGYLQLMMTWVDDYC